jgi:hypothetical protein
LTTRDRSPSHLRCAALPAAAACPTS